MSEIIRNAYERAIIEKNPLPVEADIEHFNSCLEQIAEIFETDLNDLFCSFNLDSWNESEDIDVYILSWAIKRYLPSLYRDIVCISGYTNIIGGYYEKVYRLDILDKIEGLKKRESDWVWKHRGLVDNFMSDTKTMEKLEKVKNLFPLTIMIIN